MSKRMRSLPYLQVMTTCGPKLRKMIVGHAPDHVLMAICECALNVLKGVIPLTQREKRQLTRYKTHLRGLLNKKRLLGLRSTFRSTKLNIKRSLMKMSQNNGLVIYSATFFAKLVSCFQTSVCICRYVDCTISNIHLSCRIFVSWSVCVWILIWMLFSF